MNELINRKVKEYLDEAIMIKLVDEYGHSKVYTPTFAGANGEERGFRLHKKGISEDAFVSTEEVYKNYIKFGTDLNETYAALRDKLLTKLNAYEMIASGLFTLETIYPVVLNKKLSTGLEEMNYHVDLPWTDEFTVFFVQPFVYEGKNATAMVTKEVFEAFNLSEKTFMKLAVANLKPFTELLDEFIRYDDEPPCENPDPDKYVVGMTNRTKASGILLDEKFFEEELKKNGWESAIIHLVTCYEFLMMKDTDNMDSAYHYQLLLQRTIADGEKKEVLTLKPLRYRVGEGFSVLEHPGEYYKAPVDLVDIYQDLK